MKGMLQYKVDGLTVNKRYVNINTITRTELLFELTFFKFGIHPDYREKASITFKKIHLIGYHPDGEDVLYSNDVWTITDIGKLSSVMIDNSSGNVPFYHTDYPIMYDGGSIAYDRPELIPEYMKEKVNITLTLIRKDLI